MDTLRADLDNLVNGTEEAVVLQSSDGVVGEVHAVDDKLVVYVDSAETATKTLAASDAAILAATRSPKMCTEFAHRVPSENRAEIADRILTALIEEGCRVVLSPDGVAGVYCHKQLSGPSQ